MKDQHELNVRCNSQIRFSLVSLTLIISKKKKYSLRKGGILRFFEVGSRNVGRQHNLYFSTPVYFTKLFNFFNWFCG